MKKILFSIAVIVSFKMVGYGAWGDESLVNRSSYTSTNDTLASISSTTMPGGIFVGVVVSTGNGMVTFYDTNGVKTSTIGAINLTGSSSGSFYIPFEVRLSSGLTYTTTGNSGITIIYKITRPN